MLIDFLVTKLFSIILSWIAKQYDRKGRNIFNRYNYYFEKFQS
jgi:hypothetical protein